jgi:triphosphoribosyl-dephospho-CoA synthase
MSFVAALARNATQSLLDELATTPKPGLVDRDHSGAHTDLCYDRLSTSALALQSSFLEIAKAAYGAPITRDLREEVGDIGRRGERAMLASSGGSNTHRGALWAIGLLVAARASAGEQSAESVAENAGRLARLPDRFSSAGYSNGRVVAQRYRARGARGEAADGFPHLMKVALPALRSGAASANVLLQLVATLDDTCLYHRGGPAAVREARAGARDSLAAGGVSTAAGRLAIERLDSTLLERNASPGGCADLLAAALFLNSVTE